MVRKKAVEPPLAEVNAVSQRDRDNAIGAADSAEAQVLAAQAQVRKAELGLSFTLMTAHETEGSKNRP